MTDKEPGSSWKAVKLSELLPLPEEPTIEIDWKAETIDIYGGQCAPKNSPYWIGFDRVTTVDEALDWMAHLTGKRWAGHSGWFHKLRAALLEVLEHNSKGGDWVNVNDALPTGSRAVLAFCQSENMLTDGNFCCFTATYGYENPEGSIRGWAHFGGSHAEIEVSDLRVTHWQPLPRFPESAVLSQVAEVEGEGRVSRAQRTMRLHTNLAKLRGDEL